MPTRTATPKKTSAKKPTSGPTKTPARMTLEETMAELEKAGSEQTRKTYRRHGASDPLFGVSFATLKTLRKRIRVDHELGLALWDTGNFDARNLAVKIVDPAAMKKTELDAWAAASDVKMCTGYVAYLAAEGPHGPDLAEEWLASKNDVVRANGWSLVGALAMISEAVPQEWFLERIEELAASINDAPNAVRESMNGALISLGCRDATTRKCALAAAKRIGVVKIDHGDTACKTPDATTYINKAWTHSKAKGFDSPAAQERARESMRTRC